MSARQFTAVARPSGDAQLEVPGPLVHVIEHSRWVIRRELLYSETEALALRDALNGALRTLAHGRAILTHGEPTAYAGPWPIRDHGTLAEVEGAPA